MALIDRQKAALERPGLPSDETGGYVEIIRMGVECRTVLFVDKERDTFNGAPSWFASTAALGYVEAGKGLLNKAAVAIRRLRSKDRKLLANFARDMLANVGSGPIVVAEGEAGIHARRRLSVDELETLPREWLEAPPAGD